MTAGDDGSLDPVLDEGASMDEVDESPLRRLFNIRTLASFAIAAIIVVIVVLFVDVDWADTWQTMISANPGWFLVAFVVYYATFPMRGLRWKLIMRNIGVTKETNPTLPGTIGMSEIIYLGWFANALIPAKLGDAYRAYLLKKNAKVSFSRTFGTVFAERVIDMLVLFVLLLAAGLTFVGRQDDSNAAAIIWVGFFMAIAIVVGLILFWRLGEPIQRRLPERYKEKWMALHEGTLHSFRRLPAVAALTVTIWMFEAGRLFFIAVALGFSIEPPLILFVALAGSILTTVPFTPGGLALVEIGTAGLLALLAGLTTSESFGVALLDRTISYWSLVIGGLIVFIFTKKR